MDCIGRVDIVFFFQAEDGIRDLVRSRGLGDVYKRQPLDPPNDIIVLQDPFLQLFIYNEVHPNTKDLFFSGHTATVFIFMLLLWNRLQFKLIFGCLTILMAALLLFQHCHLSLIHI